MFDYRALLEIQLSVDFLRVVKFLGVPYNQTFDFVTGQFVKILTRPVCEDFDAGLFVKNVDNS